MSKHHHHNRPQNNQKPEVSAPAAPETPAVAGDEEDLVAKALASGAEETATDPEPAKENPPSQEQVAPTKTPEPEAPAPKVEAVDIEKTATSAPKITFGRAKAEPTAAPINKAGVKQIMDNVPEDLHLHTPQGRQLIKMFDEYAQLCKEARSDDGNAYALCARKLYDIMVICCPRGGYNGNANYMNELIGIVFKRLVQGYGTMFKESTLLKADYRLPTPADSMKFDAFYSSMYQLVEAAKTGAKIRFNNNALSKVLQSPAAMVVITNIRRRLEAR